MSCQPSPQASRRRALSLLHIALAVVVLVACSEPPRPTINLYRAIHAGDLDQIKRHVYWGTDVNQADPEGNFPLHVAARRGRVVIARELLRHGADVNAQNAAGETPLYSALAEGKTQLAEVLIGEGAADDIQSLLFALVGNGVTDRDSLDLLVKRGADINARTDAGATALQIAVADGQLLLAKRLIDLGADVNLPDAGGRTPLAIAMQGDEPKLIGLLERFGARPAALEPTD